MIERMNVKVEEFKGKSKSGNEYLALDLSLTNRNGDVFKKRVFLNAQETQILNLMNK